LAEALSRVRSLALADSCSAASIALDGVFFRVVVVSKVARVVISL
jgi:hypothetical protein